MNYFLLIGWALFGVNLRPLQEIEAIMGGGWIFDTGPFFVRLQYVCSYCNAYSGCYAEQNFGPTQWPSLVHSLMRAIARYSVRCSRYVSLEKSKISMHDLM